MSQQIFVNLPVADLRRSMEFFSALGFSFDPRFTDENAACLVTALTEIPQFCSLKFPTPGRFRT